MGNLRFLVNGRSDAVTCKLPDDRKPLRFGIRLNGMTDIPDSISGIINQMPGFAPALVVCLTSPPRIRARPPRCPKDR